MFIPVQEKARASKHIQGICWFDLGQQVNSFAIWRIINLNGANY
jgi:hypothetical protein